MKSLLLGLAAFNLVMVSIAHADAVLATKKLSDNVYALIGPLTNRDAENLGNNANFGVIVTDDGVVLVDPGATYRGAEMIHAAIREITEKPVRLVINTGGQDHRWLGNAYFREQGARIIASEETVSDQKARLQDQLARLSRLVGSPGIEGTEPAYADETFADKKVVTLGKTRIEVRYLGHAHTPGASIAWLPEERIVFAGDIVYIGRMLRIGPESAHRSWISAFEAMAALQPKIVVGGHGQPADLSKATADTYDYLVFLRESVLSFMNAGQGIEDVGSIDQSRFSYLDNYESLKGRNAQRVFEELEWE